MVESQGDDNAYICKNIKSSYAAIISEKIATLHELRTVYDMEDFLNFLEIIQVNRLNEIKQMEKMKAKR